jgi:hypothetical protein
VWKKEDNEIINLHPENPHFRIGDIKALIHLEALEDCKNLCLIIHRVGHASNEDLENILSELDALGISYEIINL